MHFRPHHPDLSLHCDDLAIDAENLVRPVALSLPHLSYRDESFIGALKRGCLIARLLAEQQSKGVGPGRTPRTLVAIDPSP